MASFTWAAGTDSGAGATVENGLTYDLQISTTSNFSKLMFPGQMGASPRMGSYLKPPKIFNSNTYYGIVLKSTDPWNAQTTASYGLRTDTTYYYRVKTVDSALAESAWSGSGTVNTGVGPATSTITSTAGVGEVTLNWSSAGDDGMIGNLTGTYRIQYATYTASWSTSTTPTNATTVTIATTTQTPASAQAKLVTGLTGGLTYYFVLWTADEVPHWSTISNTTSAVPVADLVAPSTSTLAATSGNPEEVTLTWTSAGDDGGSGNLTGNYRIQYATYTVAWSTSSTPMDATTVTIATTTQVPGSAQSHTVTGLTSGLTYYFVLWTEDEVPNWSGISNTTSAVGGYWFDSNQIEVDGPGGGLNYGNVAWGDYDNDGDMDVLTNGYTGTTRELRIYKNNGNGTMDTAQIEVDGAGGGLNQGGAAWGDYDNDGDLDVLTNGYTGTTQELRIYKNNGNGTMDAAQIELDGAEGGLRNGGVAWGDYDNDGDLDVLLSGYTGATRELRIYENNGNGTIDAAQIEVDGARGGLSSGGEAWGDYDNDGDLDVLVSGYTEAFERVLRIYKNNGNGTLNVAQIEIGSPWGLELSDVAWGDFDNDGDLDFLTSGFSGTSQVLRINKNNGNGTMDNAHITVPGAEGGLQNGSVAWGDFDNDGDLDVLASGYTASTRELRVYKNNGNGTVNKEKIEVDHAGGGLRYGGVAWGDYDSDGDLDVLANGEDSAVTMQLRIYKNFSNLVQTNTAPTSPGTLSSAWNYNGLGTSTATFKWAPGSDSGTGATPANVLTYQMEISTMSNFTGKSVVSGQWATPGMGNYLKPPKIYDGNTNHGVGLKYLPFTNTTYYYRVKTIDAGLKESAWSATGSLYTLVASSVPSVVTDLVASSVTTKGQILLTWTAPLNINSGGSGTYDVRYRTSGAITTDGEFDGATTATGEPTPGTPGAGQTMGISGLVPGTTYYFAIKSSNVNGTSGLDISSPRPSAAANSFDATEIDLDGAGGGLNNGGVAWGDYDNDGDLDVLVNGFTSVTVELRIYKNNGNGTMDAAQIEVEGAAEGLYRGDVAWGDYDNDGDIDILTNGYTGTTRELRIYKNNGNGTINPVQIEVDGAGGGLDYSGVAWGDYDNDGDLDVLINGYTGTTRELRIYKNNGNGTMNPAQVEVDSAGGGLNSGGVAWGDYDSDGDLDVLVNGFTTANQRELRIYKNNGNGTMNPVQIEVDGAAEGLYQGDVAWGDYDNDGDLDVLINGYTWTAGELRIYKNNGNGTMDAAQIEVDGAGGGLQYSSVAWGDYDNDGDLDVLTNGFTASTRELRVYKNNGNGTMNRNQIEVDDAGGGLRQGGVAWGDYDSDGDLDVLANGDDSAAVCQLRIYKNYISLAQSNTTPSAPGTLSGSFSFDAGSVSIASFTWAAGTDSGAGATVENGLTYDLQISTTSNFSKLMFPGQLGASPRMGSYLKPPKIFNSNTYYGVVLKSTDPWNAQTTASYGLRTDTTYYYRVKTVDSVLAESAWSGSGTVNTGVGPSTSTVAGAATANPGEVTLTWASAGDDGMIGNLTGNYRIQYATYPASWSTSTTPTNATTVTISTTNVVPGAAQSRTVTGLTGGLTYYFVLWTGDEVPNWSGISNTTSTIPTVPVRSVTIISGSPLAFGVLMTGSQMVASTGVVVRNDGNVLNTYIIRASTQTPGTPGP
ncbi:MAG: VCBS repeat-containing protein [Elusimicrobia bacterium]|nr:VCBS repeat-containing protein [Elusimicrobiota bacterium]